MTKKLFPIVGLLLAIAVVLTACGGGSTPATSEAAPAEQPTAAPAEVIFTTPLVMASPWKPCVHAVPSSVV
ncbi:MAG: hypothetical protein KIT07_01620 [Anaerolineales bacterium]|nr:hypothetical protein [Anaerolineales bacterium]